MKRILPVAALSLITLHAAPVEFHVSPSGKVGASGGATDPLPSLVLARDAARALSPEQRSSGVTILMGNGLYSMPDGCTLDSHDSGTTNAPLLITAESGAHPVLLGGHLVPGDQIEKVKDPALLERLDPSARNHIRQIDLARLGIGKVSPFSAVFSQTWSPLQVVHGETTLPISRWPNGEYGFTTMKSVTDNGDSTHGGIFVYRGDRPSRWTKALTEDGVWLRGFWRVPWVIQGVQVKEINTANSTITLMKDVGGGIGSKYKKDAQGRRCGDGTEPWYAINLPEEIDEPGEWAVDFKRQLLLIWVPDGIDAAHPLVIADNSNPIISFDDASHITLRGLTLRGSLTTALQIKGGEGDLVAGCTIANTANTAVIVRDGKQHLIVSNDIFETGLSGIDVSGGNRTTLEPSGHQILNNDIFRAGNNFPVAALITGFGTGKSERWNTVGNHVAHNRIHDSVYGGVWFGGNDNIIELNEVYRVGLNAGDLGGFYASSGWTGFGNILRNNFVHHSMNASGFYMDDGTCGDIVTGNIVFKTNMGVLVGGGHFNKIVNNIFIDCNRAVAVDSRGVSRHYTATDKRLKGDLDLVPYNESPWKERYPQLVNLISGGETTIPKGDEITGNVMINCGKLVALDGGHGTLDLVVQSNNVTASALDDFRDAENFDFTLKPGSNLVASISGFPAIPFQQIGLQPDEYRPSVPPRNIRLLREGDTKMRNFDSSVDIKASNAH